MSIKLRCGECGEKKFEEQNVRGKFFTPWRDFPRAYLTKDLVLPVCGNCGNYAIVDDEAERMDQAMEASVRDQASQFIDIIKSKADITAAKLATLLGVTPEYISMLSNQKNTPSYRTWNMLKLIARTEKSSPLSSIPTGISEKKTCCFGPKMEWQKLKSRNSLTRE